MNLSTWKDQNTTQLRAAAPRHYLSPEQLARAAGTDKANRRMRRAGRTEWSLEDYNAAVSEYYRVHALHSDSLPTIPHVGDFK